MNYNYLSQKKRINKHEINILKDYQDSFAEKFWIKF